MWFKPDWFALQFLMVAVGFAVKELVRWNKEGRRAHIFNPSSFPLGLFALGLILTGSTGSTWGPEIAVTQIFPPHIYLLIFLVSLPAQLLFGVAAMTMSAVATTWLFILGYYALTGGHFFSPAALGGGAVPIAAAARSDLLRRLDPAALGAGLVPRTWHLGYVTAWTVIFTVMQLQTGAEVARARGVSLLSQGRVEDTIAHYRRLTREPPERAAFRNELGYVLLRAGRAPPRAASAPAAERPGGRQAAGAARECAAGSFGRPPIRTARRSRNLPRRRRPAPARALVTAPRPPAGKAGQQEPRPPRQMHRRERQRQQQRRRQLPPAQRRRVAPQHHPLPPAVAVVLPRERRGQRQRQRALERRCARSARRSAR